jgi:anti-sigma B factor antagonist
MTQENKFVINQRHLEKVECLYLKGYLDAHTSPILESALETLVKDGKNNILVNFRDLDYISSAGLGVFMAFIEDVREAGGDIKLTDMQQKVFSVFDLLGFPMLFDIEKEEKTAIDKFNSNEERVSD